MTSPRTSSSSALVPVIRAYASSRASRPAPSTSSRDSVCCTVPARWRSTYCSLTRRENSASVMAMNGTSNGTSNTGKPARSAASSTAGGVASKANPSPTPEGGQLGPGQLLDVGGLALGAAAHAEAGGEQHLAAAQEPGRVLELGHVRPADRPVQPARRPRPAQGGARRWPAGRQRWWSRSPFYAESYNSVPGNWTGGHYPGACTADSLRPYPGGGACGSWWWAAPARWGAGRCAT